MLSKKIHIFYLLKLPAFAQNVLNFCTNQEKPKRVCEIGSEMLLKGDLVPRFNIHCSRKKRPFDQSCHVLCISKISLLSWETSLKSDRWKCIKVQCKDKLQQHTEPTTPGSSIQKHPELAFDRLQPCGEELHTGERRVFGRFVARGALQDEEYWSAAWLRAEAQCESVSYVRHSENYKRKFTDQEFYALKRRCSGRHGNSLKCMCIISVKKEDPNVRRTVLNSVVGTLDLSVRQFLSGETFPGDFKKASSILVSHEVCDSYRYAYVANVCVSKFARRQGIAYNMMYFAIDVAISSGMKELFVHVNADNQPAWDLYKKIGFKIVEAASSPSSKDRMLLMHLQL